MMRDIKLLQANDPLNPGRVQIKAESIEGSFNKGTINKHNLTLDQNKKPNKTVGWIN